MSGLLLAVKEAKVRELEKQLALAKEDLAKYKLIPHKQASGDTSVKQNRAKSAKGE